ncbi:hypothetical protein ACIOHB_20530 [Streptomyces microflavus]|uniref:hypothetical protein n=1 Tax=Streptomyces microflavus TaxID=1919 RepID=UPI003406A4C9
MEVTYDVRVWQLEAHERRRGNSYGVRWGVDGQKHPKTFQTFALADGFRAELVTATHHGVPFHASTGLPDQHLPAASSTSWYDCAGLRPEEAVALLVRDTGLPECGWGELLVHATRPETGRHWTNTGHVHDERNLKGRGRATFASHRPILNSSRSCVT